jgi:hypothetical protein
VTRIVRIAYRYQRPPGKRKPVALEVPAVVTAKSSRRPIGVKAAAEEKEEKCPRLSGPGQEDPTPANDDRKPAIVSIRRTPTKILPPDLLAETPEEHQRHGDAADAMWREIRRRIAGKT